MPITTVIWITYGWSSGMWRPGKFVFGRPGKLMPIGPRRPRRPSRIRRIGGSKIIQDVIMIDIVFILESKVCKPNLCE